MSEIRTYAFPVRLKFREKKAWLEKAIYWQSAATENTKWLAGDYLAYPKSQTIGHHTPSHTVRRTSRMLRIVGLCLIGLAAGPIGNVRCRFCKDTGIFEPASVPGKPAPCGCRDRRTHRRPSANRRAS